VSRWLARRQAAITKVFPAITLRSIAVDFPSRGQLQDMERACLPEGHVSATPSTSAFLAILKVTGGLDSKIVGKQLRMTAFMKNQDRGRQRDHAERRMIVATERFMNAKTADEKERARKWAHAWQALSRKLK
jgi:hypothetical protein